MEPLYKTKDGLLLPGNFAVGPWFKDVQHGGAIAALLARELEKADAPTEMRISRLTVDLFRKVPMEPVYTTSEIVRDGLRIGSLVASLWSQDGKTELARATAMRVRVDEDVVDASLVPGQYEEDKPPDLENIPLTKLDLPSKGFDYARTFEHRRDIGPEGSHGFTAWRLLHQVVEGEAVSPLVRTAATADLLMSANGILGHGYISINPDLTIHLQREMQGEWLTMKGTARVDALGSGESEGVLFDEKGRIGSVYKTLLVFKGEPRAE